MNGSSLAGFCNNLHTRITDGYCLQPNTSVLFDGHNPTLTGLDGGMWADQLLTLNGTLSSKVVVGFDDQRVGVSLCTCAVAVVLFNCPQWGISVRTIYFPGYQSGSYTQYAHAKAVSLDSCDSLVKVCQRDVTLFPKTGLIF